MIAIDPTAQPDAQRYQALRAGDALGWWKYLHLHDGVYVVELPGRRRRELRPAGVLAWVAGQEDARDRPGEILGDAVGAV